MKTFRARSLFSIALACMLGGCSSFDLYDKQKDDQAKAMKDGVAAVSFANVFNDARARHAAMSDAIAAQHQRLAEANAKLKLLAVLGSTESLSHQAGLQGVLQAKWGALTCSKAGDPGCATPSQRAVAWAAEFCPDDKNPLCLLDGPPQYSQIVAQGLIDYDPNSLQRFQRDAKNGASQVMALALKPAPNCVATQPIDSSQPAGVLPKPTPAMPSPEEYEKSLPPDRIAAADLYELVYWPRCEQLLMAQYRLDWLMQSAPQSGIGAALQAWRDAREALNEKQKAANAARAKYDELNQAYKDALKELEADLPGAEDKAKDLLKKAGAALDALNGILELGEKRENPVGAAAQADERIQQLREIVAALGGAGTGGDAESALSADVRNHLAAIATLPRLIDDSAEMFEEAEQARLAPLMLEISYQEQVAIGAKRRVAAEVDDVERKKAAYFTLVAQAGKIAEAQERLDVAMLALEGAGSRRLYELLNGANGSPTPAQEALLDALAIYYESEVKHELAIQKIAYQTAAASYQRNLDEDEIALNEWLALARSDSQILAAYFASGMKAEDIAALLVQLVGLGGIAVGVNR
jgi:hypothetical protein